MKQHRLTGGVGFLSLVLFCLYALPAFAQDGTPITAANAGNLELVATVGEPGNFASAASIAFSPDNQTMAVCGADGGIEFWNLSIGAKIGLLDVECVNITFSPDGSLIAATDLHNVSLYDTASHVEIGTYPGRTFTFSPDGQYLAVIGSDGVLTLYVAQSGSVPPMNAPTETAIPVVPTDIPAPPPTAIPAGVTCTLTTNGETNLRSGPGSSFDRTGLVVGSTALVADGQAKGTDGATWYHLTSNEWVHSNLVSEPPECSQVPLVAP